MTASGSRRPFLSQASAGVPAVAALSVIAWRLPYAPPGDGETALPIVVVPAALRPV